VKNFNKYIRSYKTNYNFLMNKLASQL
jgi:hypothetical protein